MDIQQQSHGCKRSALENDLGIQIIDRICTLEAQKTQQRTSQKVHGSWCLWVPSKEKVMWQKTPGSMAHYILPVLNMTKPWFLDVSGTVATRNHVPCPRCPRWPLGVATTKLNHVKIKTKFKHKMIIQFIPSSPLKSVCHPQLSLLSFSVSRYGYTLL